MRAPAAVLASQRTYRALLRATANPGELVKLTDVGVAAYEAVLTTLLDHEVTFCVVGEDAREAEDRLSSGTGARTASLGDADFVLVLGGDSDGGLQKMRRGTLEEPADGATAIYVVRRLSDQGPLKLVLSGPGVPDERIVGVEGLADIEVVAIGESRSGYPMGVDVYLVDGGGTLVGLPRSTGVGVVS